MEILVGILTPFIGTTLGSAMVFFMKDKINTKAEKILLGFASGVMVSAAFFSLLLPALERSGNGVGIVSLGFILGMLFLEMIDHFTPHMHYNEEEDGPKSALSKLWKMVLAVTIHNIPEGMSVGVVLASGALLGNMNAALALSLGIALQNFPEGAIISMPLKEEGHSKNKAFAIGTLSGIVEPIAAVIALYLTTLFEGILPITLSFAAGAMFFVVIEDIIPDAQIGKHSNLATIGFAVGFVIMMILDVVLG